MTAATHSTADRRRQELGARAVGARIVAALLDGPAVVSVLAERSGRDVDTVLRWLDALEDEGVAVRQGCVRVAGGGWATVWAMRGQTCS